MVQRLALAQALINEPDLLVLDEPTEGLDQLGRRLIHNVIHRQRQQGKTTLLVSHLAGDVQRLADRIGVLVHGQLVFLGPVSKLTSDPASGIARPLEEALVHLYEGCHEEK